MSIVDVEVADGAVLRVTDEGEGRPLLFVHGLACDTSDWLAQLRRFRSDYRVIAPDLRGHGRSTVTSEGYDLDTYTDDLVRLLDELEVRSCVVIGHSLGSLIAGWLAIEYPSRVSALVGLDPAWAAPSERSMYQKFAAAAAEPGGFASVFEKSDSALTPEYFRESHRRGALTTNPRVIEKTWQNCFLVENAVAFDENQLRRRTCPMLVVHSKSHQGRAAWQKTISVHPADVVVELPVGHWPHHDAPEIINQLIADWIVELPC